MIMVIMWTIKVIASSISMLTTHHPQLSLLLAIKPYRKVGDGGQREGGERGEGVEWDPTTMLI